MKLRSPAYFWNAMLSNAELVEIFEQLAQLKELVGENAFAANAYRRAGQNLERISTPISELTPTEREQLLGKGMASKALQWAEVGTSPELEEVKASVPAGVIEMLTVPGFGVKKVSMLWRTHGITEFADLVARAEAGTMAALPGFGKGTQEAFLKHLVSRQERSGKWRMHRAQEAAAEVIDILTHTPGVSDCVAVGAVARSLEIADSVEVLVGLEGDASSKTILAALSDFVLDRGLSGPGTYKGTWKKGNLTVYTTLSTSFAREQVLLTGPDTFLNLPAKAGGSLRATVTRAESSFGEFELVDAALGFYLEPELRDDPDAVPKEGERLITPQDIRGILHCHSTYSDGQNTLREMALHCRSLGYAYFGIADHSQTATYANGLLEERVLQQWKEIDLLNAELAPFHIFKGIESDILSDGSLDYPQELLVGFDYVVASVHSSLRMTQEKATERILKAIENPYTTILGHATGRLLLERDGYPLDFEAVLQAAARHNVSIEVNANPYRLDLDWRHIRRARELGIRISINPDAHKLAGFDDMPYGVSIARKGGLQPQECLNAFELKDFSAWLEARKR
jgi:DNA polymerase (family X)